LGSSCYLSPHLYGPGAEVLTPTRGRPPVEPARGLDWRTGSHLHVRAVGLPIRLREPAPGPAQLGACRGPVGRPGLTSHAPPTADPRRPALHRRPWKTGRTR
jgi:hypothetical protein